MSTYVPSAPFRRALAAPAVIFAGVLALWGPAAAADLPTDPLPGPLDERSAAASRPAGAGEELIGLFRLDPGQCGGPSGTYFQMITQGGNASDGPFVQNTDSECDGGFVTPLTPGTDGGLSTGEFQPHPDPPFDGTDALAARITQPASFFGTQFGVATNQTDPQTELTVNPPQIVHSGGTLSGDLRSFAAAWQATHFNQGSPKPNGESPGSTAPVAGTFDPGTGRFVLTWTSQIEGGPFDGFTGSWHLEGVFEPAPSTQSPTRSAPTQPSTTDNANQPTTGQPTASQPTSSPSTAGAGASAATPAAADARSTIPRSGTHADLAVVGAYLVLAGAAFLAAARRVPA